MLARDIRRNLRQFHLFLMLRPLAAGFGLGQVLTFFLERDRLWRWWSVGSIVLCFAVSYAAHRAARHYRGPVYDHLKQRLEACRPPEGPHARHP